MALDPQGDLFIGFAAAAKVDVLAAHSTTAFGLRLTAGKLTVVAGTGVPGYGGDGGSAVKAALDDPSGLAIDPAGDLLVADTANCRLRLVAASTGTRFGVSVVPGRIYTVAGDGFCGPYGDGGPARRAQLWDPGALAVNPAGDVLVADQGNRSIRLLAAATGNYYGVPLAADDLGTVAGEGSYGPYLADGLPALSEIGELNFPTGVAVGANGDLYVADGDMHGPRHPDDRARPGGEARRHVHRGRRPLGRVAPQSDHVDPDDPARPDRIGPRARWPTRLQRHGGRRGAGVAHGCLTAAGLRRWSAPRSCPRPGPG